MGSIRLSLEASGFVIVEHVLNETAVANIVSAIETQIGTDPPGSAGARNLHQRVPEVADLIRQSEISSLIQNVLPGAFPVQNQFADQCVENWSERRDRSMSGLFWTPPKTAGGCDSAFSCPGGKVVLESAVDAWNTSPKRSTR